MRDGLRAGFMGVVDEIALGVEAGILGDDFDAVFIGADRAIGAEPEEDGAGDFGGFDGEIGIDGEAGMAEIVIDADRELVCGVLRFNSSNTAFAMAGVKSFDDSP